MSRTSVIPRREGDDQDFVFQLLYLMSDAKVAEAYTGLLPAIKRYVPQVADDVMERAKGIGWRDSQTLMILLVLVMDDENELTQYTLQHAFPFYRLAYFRAWFRDFSSHFVGVKLVQTRVPDFRLIMPTVRGMYWRRMDHQRKFKDFFAAAAQPQQPQLSPPETDSDATSATKRR